MWEKPLIVIIMFYFFALLQSSFFVHFNLFGAVPNLVFVLFFLLLFFEQPGSFAPFSKGFDAIFLALVGGFFLDVFSFAYLGPSVAIFLIIGALLIKIKKILKATQDPYPFYFFLPLFFVFLVTYNVLISVFYYFAGFSKMLIVFNSVTVWSLIYNIFIAVVAFLVYKSISSRKKSSKFFIRR